MKNRFDFYWLPICDAAESRGHLNILQWTKENGCDWVNIENDSKDEYE